MNVKLLRKIKKHILAEPSRYTFDWVEQSSKSPCGTKACIAGWAMVLSGTMTAEELLSHDWYSDDAARILDLTHEEKMRLFIYWPNPFDSTQNSAIAAGRRIDHFIRTKGAE